MSDGKITYEVRVDGSKIDSDLNSAKSQISSGLSALTSMGETAAKNLGSVILSSLSKSLSGAGEIIKKAVSVVPALSAEADPTYTKAPKSYYESQAKKPLLSGISAVPYDNMPAILHKGEAVLSAAENSVLQGMGGISYVKEQAEKSGAKRENSAEMAKLEIPPQNVNVNVSIDGYEMARVVANATNELGRQLNTKIIR